MSCDAEMKLCTDLYFNSGEYRSSLPNNIQTASKSSVEPSHITNNSGEQGKFQRCAALHKWNCTRQVLLKWFKVLFPTEIAGDESYLQLLYESLTKRILLDW